MTLARKLNDLHLISKRELPSEIQRIMKEADQEIAQRNIPEQALGEGESIPDVQLIDEQNNFVTLRELTVAKPLVISFFRGGWCPYCLLELREYQKIIHNIEDMNATFIAISPQIPSKLQKLKQSNELAYPLLSDVNNQAAKSFHLVHELPPPLQQVYRGFGVNLTVENNTDRWELPIPATYVVDPEGLIHLSYVNPDYTQRLEPALVLNVLAKMNHVIA